MSTLKRKKQVLNAKSSPESKFMMAEVYLTLMEGDSNWEMHKKNIQLKCIMSTKTWTTQQESYADRDKKEHKNENKNIDTSKSRNNTEIR